MIKNTSPLYKWLTTQDKEFAQEILSKDDVFGDEYMTIDKLKELDKKYNNIPEE